jgi:hypothetical protein
MTAWLDRRDILHILGGIPCRLNTRSSLVGPCLRDALVVRLQKDEGSAAQGTLKICSRDLLTRRMLRDTWPTEMRDSLQFKSVKHSEMKKSAVCVEKPPTGGRRPVAAGASSRRCHRTTDACRGAFRLRAHCYS